jgi:predicted RNase H-like HicB family nuclease
MKKFSIIIEATEDAIWGRWEDGEGMVVTSGETLDSLKVNFIEAANLYFEEMNRPTIRIKAADLEFQVDMEHLFQVNDFINISKLAEHIGLNKSLLRQYAKGIKYPSLKQALRIEEALKDIGTNLLSTKVISRQA